MDVGGQGFPTGPPQGPMGLQHDSAQPSAAQTSAALGMGLTMGPASSMLLPCLGTQQRASSSIQPGHLSQEPGLTGPAAGLFADPTHLAMALCHPQDASMPPILSSLPNATPGANTFIKAEADATSGSPSAALTGSAARQAGAGVRSAHVGAEASAAVHVKSVDTNDPEAVAAALTARIAAAGASIIFEKSLTASDVSGGGRVVVPKSIAEQYFPKLEAPSGVTICATDLEGRCYTFKWRYWVNNSSRMYLLEAAGELHRNYGLEVGDVMVFAQKPDGSLVVAGRVASKSDAPKKAPIKRPSAATTSTPVTGGGAGSRGARESRGSRPPSRPPVAAAAATATAAAAAGSYDGAAGTAAEGGLGGGRTVGGRKRKAAVGGPVAGGGGGDPRVRGRGEEGAMSLAVLDMEAPSDGVFRAVVGQPGGSVALGVSLARNNRWTATLDVADELYQAFFDAREDAVEALIAAGVTP